MKHSRIVEPPDELELEGVRMSLGSLTERETEVLKYLVRGDTSKEIARILEISPRTVEDHRLHIFKKLEAKNAAELVRRIVFAEALPVPFKGQDAQGA